MFDVLCSGWSDVVSESELVLRDVDLCDSGSCVVVCWKCLFSVVVSSSVNTNIDWSHEDAEYSSILLLYLAFPGSGQPHNQSAEIYLQEEL